MRRSPTPSTSTGLQSLCSCLVRAPAPPHLVWKLVSPFPFPLLILLAPCQMVPVDTVGAALQATCAQSTSSHAPSPRTRHVRPLWWVLLTFTQSAHDRRCEEEQLTSIMCVYHRPTSLAARSPSHWAYPSRCWPGLCAGKWCAMCCGVLDRITPSTQCFLPVPQKIHP